MNKRISLNRSNWLFKDFYNACPKIRQLWQTDFFERPLEHLKET